MNEFDTTIRRMGLYDEVDEICKKAGCLPRDVNSGDRTRHVVAARRKVIALLSEAGLSSKAIGRLLRRDYTTILHALKTG